MKHNKGLEIQFNKLISMIELNYGAAAFIYEITATTICAKIIQKGTVALIR